MKDEIDFAAWLDELYRSRYTGKIELDVFNGTPRAATPMGPKVTFTPPIPLDSREKRSDALSVLGRVDRAR